MPTWCVPIHCFNSRSREGSDCQGGALSCPPGCFNSRSREGSDHLATGRQRGQEGFNSRSREGSDYQPRTKLDDIDEFQFTLP